MLDLFVCYLPEAFLRDARRKASSLDVAFSEVDAIFRILVVEAILNELLDTEDSLWDKAIQLLLHMRTYGSVELFARLIGKDFTTRGWVTAGS